MADALVSEASEVKFVWVQVPSSAPTQIGRCESISLSVLVRPMLRDSHRESVVGDGYHAQYEISRNLL